LLDAATPHEAKDQGFWSDGELMDDDDPDLDDLGETVNAGDPGGWVGDCACGFEFVGG
jgi:hypothetical protein